MNDSIHLETSVSKLNKMVAGLFALVLLLSVANMGTSMAVYKLSNAPETVAKGEEFVLPMKHDGDRTFACVAPTDAAEMWRASSEGIVTTARVLETDEETGVITSERGVRLSFDGSFHNDTHLCFPTGSLGKSACVDFTRNDCDSAAGPVSHHERRQLFRYLIANKENQAKMDSENAASHPGGLRKLQCKRSCGGGGYSVVAPGPEEGGFTLTF